MARHVIDHGRLTSVALISGDRTQVCVRSPEAKGGGAHYDLTGDVAASIGAHIGEAVDVALVVGADAPTPGPSRDELAARFAECERQLTDVTREHGALTDRYGAAVLRLAERDREVAEVSRQRDEAHSGVGALRLAVIDTSLGLDVDLRGVTKHVGAQTAAALRTLAARVDREPPQRAAGVVAGVPADVVDGWCDHLKRALRGEPFDLAGEVVRAIDLMRRAAAAARQHDGGAVGRGERVERGQEGAGGVGVVAEAVERVVFGEGHVSSRCEVVVSHCGEFVSLTGAELATAMREHRGRRVRVVVEVLRGEGGSVHSSTISPSATTREAP